MTEPDERRTTDGLADGRAAPPPPRPAPPSPARLAAVAPAPSPLSGDEIRAALIRPDLLAAHVLGAPERLWTSPGRPGDAGLLLAMLAAASVVAAVPYGAFSPVGAWWKVSVLFTGSLLICVPSLHVLLQFLGFRVSLAANLTLSLVITATAGLFTFGFFPIIWFIGLTTGGAADADVSPAALSRVLLGVSLALGLVQLLRCFATGPRDLPRRRWMMVLVVAWLPLFVFIVRRMAAVLGIPG